ncbi:MAG: hypothetical protein V1773_06985 [bacterium]
MLEPNINPDMVGQPTKHQYHPDLSNLLNQDFLVQLENYLHPVILSLVSVLE